MLPVKLEHHNFTYKGPTDEIGDLSCYRDEEDGAVYSHWALTDSELQAINSGGLIELGIWVEPIPPVSLAVVGPDGESHSKVETSFEKIKIDGQTYGAPQAVVQEIEALREKAIGGIRGFQPAEGETIIITTPAGASREFIEAVMHAAHENFPDESVAVVPEDLGFHTQEGFVALVEAGQAMCDRILQGGSEASYEGSVEEAAHGWEETIGQKDGGDGNPG